MKNTQAEQAIKDGEVHYCENCKKIQPIELAHYNPDDITQEPDLIMCLICKDAIGFVENM